MKEQRLQANGERHQRKIDVGMFIVEQLHKEQNSTSTKAGYVKRSYKQLFMSGRNRLVFGKFPHIGLMDIDFQAGM